MNKFASIALCAAVSAVELQQVAVAGEVGNVDYVVFGDSKTYDATFDMLPDEKMVAAMRQGEGRDHTDWSWHLEHLEEAAKVRVAGEDLEKAREGVDGAVREYDELMMLVIEADEEHMRQCQLHREEEMNLYYQCTQNDVNNYALHHFGGQARSYPRWVQEYNVCIDHIHRAKTLHLDFFRDDGTVEKRACDPQSHDSTTYIEQQKVVIVDVEPVIEHPVIFVPPVEVIDIEVSAPAPAFEEWVHCAKEHKHCECNAGGKIAYGAPNWMNDHFDKLVIKNSAVGGLKCSNGVFGDPIHGTVKDCWCSKIIVQ